jgi:hypothetical protein
MIAKLVVFGLLFTGALIWVFREIGRNQLRFDYEIEYSALEKEVRTWVVCEGNREAIKDSFRRIEKYKCRDKEKISVLQSEFIKRFYGEASELSN